MRHDRETTNSIIRNGFNAIRLTLMYWSFLNLEAHAGSLDRMVWQEALPARTPLSAIAHGNSQFVAVEALMVLASFLPLPMA